jgi:hypothetical protein
MPDSIRASRGSNLRYEIVAASTSTRSSRLTGGTGINGYDVLFVPSLLLHQPMDILWARLKNNVALPAARSCVRPRWRHARRGAADRGVERAEDLAAPGSQHHQHRPGVINVPNWSGP